MCRRAPPNTPEANTDYATAGASNHQLPDGSQRDANPGVLVMKKRLIAAAALLTVCVSALVRAQPYVDPPARAPAQRVAESPSARTPAPREVEMPRAEAPGSGYAAAPVAAANAAPAVETDTPAGRPATYRERPASAERPAAAARQRIAAAAQPPVESEEPAYDAADAAPPAARPYPAARRAPAYARPTAYEEPAPSDRRAGYRSARFAGGGGSTWRMGRNTHAFAATIGGCRISGFAGPGGYKLDRAC